MSTRPSRGRPRAAEDFLRFAARLSFSFLGEGVVGFLRFVPGRDFVFTTANVAAPAGRP